MLEEAFTQADYAINITDTEGRLYRVNQAYLSLYKFTDEKEVLGKTQRIIRSSKTPPLIYEKMWETIKAGQTWRGDLTNRASNGEEVYVHLTISPIKRDGQVVGYMGFSLDRAQQVQLERQLLHANKLMVLGSLGAGIAHEMNNPLASILLDAEYLREIHSQTQPIVDQAQALAAAESVIRGVERMRRVLQHLLLYSKRESTLDTGIISLRELIDDSLLFLERQLTHRGIEIRLRMEDGLYLQGNRTHLESVIHNLLGNSRDAFESHPRKGPWIRLEARAIPDDFLLIEYEDNAGGISDADMERIFEPFFTTKPEGKGTGLGLALSRKIIADHDGAIECSSAQGHTLFRITLPRAENGATSRN